MYAASQIVCPNSATIQAEYGTVLFNKGNYTGERFLLDIAKTDDPDYCEIDYKFALLVIVNSQNETRAIELAARNLKVIMCSSRTSCKITFLFAYLIVFVPV